MDQAIGTARNTAAFTRRVVLRALTVVGGAAAGTALAWCLSAASASAETGTPPVPEVPVVDTIASPVTGALDTVAARLPDPPRAVDELGERVEKTAGRLGEHAHQQLPECTDPLCGLYGVGRSEAPDAGDGAGLGRSDSPSPAPAAVAPADTAAAPGAGPDRTTERTAAGRAYSDGPTRRGSPAPGMPSLPVWPAPLAPVVPAPASGHTDSAGNPGDSSLFAALPWQDRRPALVRGLTISATEAITFGLVGAQPGICPD